MTEINNRIEPVKKILKRYNRATDVYERGQYTWWAKQICQLFPQPLDDKGLPDCHVYRSFNIDKCEWEYDKELMVKTCPMVALLQPKIEEARRQGIREAIDNLKMHHCIIDVEARIKEIEDG